MFCRLVFELSFEVTAWDHSACEGAMEVREHFDPAETNTNTMIKEDNDKPMPQNEDNKPGQPMDPSPSQPNAS